MEHVCAAPDCTATLTRQPGGRRRYCSDACRQRAARARLATLTEKRCASCKRVKPIADFFPTGNMVYCRDCELAKQRASYASGKPTRGRDYSHRRSIRQRYGLTGEQYQAMVEAQGGQCAICGEQPERLRVDHDHATGAIRELLCNHCNVALAQARDNRDLLRAMIAYLERHQNG